MNLSPRALLAGGASVGLAGMLVAHALTAPVPTQAADSRRGAAGATTTVPPDKGGNGTTTTTSPTTTAHEATGTLEQYGYGEIAVTVRSSGGRITAVSVSKLETAESYSAQLAQSAIPVLRTEVLDAQSANVSAVSGATYTSNAYAASVQSALDKLKTP